MHHVPKKLAEAHNARMEMLERIVPKERNVKDRLLEVLGRFTRTEDLELKDREFVLNVFERYKKYLDEYIIDVGE